jgi:hypothetical protein
MGQYMQIPVQEFLNKLSPNQLRAALGITLTLLLSGFGFALKAAKDYVSDMKSDIKHMRTNCLPTIQANTGRQADIAEKLLESQQEANIRAAELNAYIKAKWD